MDAQPATATHLLSFSIPFPSDVLAYLQQQYHTAAITVRMDI